MRNVSVGHWQRARQTSVKKAWEIIGSILGLPVAVLTAGETYGEGQALFEKRVFATAVSLTSSTFVLELTKNSLEEIGLWEQVVLGCEWVPQQVQVRSCSAHVLSPNLHPLTSLAIFFELSDTDCSPA